MSVAEVDVVYLKPPGGSLSETGTMKYSIYAPTKLSKLKETGGHQR
jgi:hypothetical protein